MTIDVTSVQNEPDWHPDYDSMDWSGTELRNFVRDQGAKVQNTKLMVAEAVNLNYGYTDPTLNDATARNNIGYIGGHLYGTEDAGRLSPYPLAAQYSKTGVDDRVELPRGRRQRLQHLGQPQQPDGLERDPRRHHAHRAQVDGVQLERLHLVVRQALLLLHR